MAFLQLISSNPNLQQILKKNTKEIVIREHRKGYLCGWYSDSQIYNLYFRDSFDAVSFKRKGDDEFSYLNVGQYNAALCINQSIKEFFGHITKDLIEEDKSGIYEHKILINLLHVEIPTYIEFFKRHFPEFEITATLCAEKNFHLEIHTNQSLNSFLNFISLFSIFCAVINDEDIFIDEAIIERYLSIIHKLNAPYFIRYLFKTRLLFNQIQFENYKSRLEQSTDQTLHLSFGDTHSMRRTVIKSKLDFSYPIIDIGAGEGFYAIPFAKELDDHVYHAIDIGAQQREILTSKIQKEKLTNIRIYESFQEFLNTGDNETTYDILLTEVIEHMQQNIARDLIKEVLDTGKFHRFIITTPNKDFNKFYFDSNDEKRHDEHCFELTENEFEEWIQGIVKDYDMKYEFIRIGDIVDNIPVSVGVVIYGG